MKKIAAVVDSLGPTQSSFYLIKEFNKLLDNIGYSPICFYNNLAPAVVKPFFTCTNVSFYAPHDGCTIADTVEMANLILKTQNSSNKFFYVWDLEWIRKPMDFAATSRVMRNKNINLLARSESHKQLIEKYANREVAGVVDNWNIEQLEEILWTPEKS